MKRLKKIVKNIIPLALALGIIFGLPTYVFQIVIIRGNSMEPTYSNRNVVYMDRISHYFKGYQRGDIVLAELDDSSALKGEHIVKRIIGIPGDTVQIIDGKVYINDELWTDDVVETCGFSGIAESPVTLGDNEYFLMGDNRTVSLDSRDKRIGIVSGDDLKGQIRFQLF